MEVLEAIKRRRSIRSFIDKPISDEDAVKILEAGRWAPTGSNKQGWTFVYVNDPQTVTMIKNCSPGFYGDAPAAIVIGFQGRPIDVDVLDMGFAAENMVLAAQSLGIGSCVICSFIKDSINIVINAPEGWNPIIVLSLGYPDKVPDPPPKKALSEIVYLGAFEKKWEKLEGD